MDTTGQTGGPGLGTWIAGAPWGKGLKRSISLQRGHRSFFAVRPEPNPVRPRSQVPSSEIMRVHGCICSL